MTVLDDAEDKMMKAVEATERAFNAIRTGRASASLLDRIEVDYYGSPTPLKSLANVNTPDPQTIAIQPYDKGAMAQIEKAIAMSDLGLTPNNDGNKIRLNIPPLTEERRKELVKIANKEAENGRVSVRNARRDAIDEVRKQEKDKDSPLSEDESADLQDRIQKLTNQYTSEIDKLFATKEKDIMTV